MLDSFPAIPNALAWFALIVTLLIGIGQSWRPVLNWTATWNRRWALRRARSIARRLARIDRVHRDPAAAAASAVGALMGYIVGFVVAISVITIVVVFTVTLKIGNGWSLFLLLAASAVVCIPLARNQTRINELLEMKNMQQFRRRSLREVQKLLAKANVESATRDTYLCNAVENAQLGYILRDPFQKFLSPEETGERFKEFVNGIPPYR
ncbi:hypothetical protein [Dongia sedimenti]|uniref:Uncharacterized protein n=1 Tax=Dongia sedimenti TaxID=3064282 RepID=A0ABU0YKE6_9PROT|nr:hypothetical protein [Rhodospirillaceae bacterium R-7]